MLSKINAALLRLYARFEQEKGQALAEYGLILALIAVVAVVGLTLLGTLILGNLNFIGSKMAVPGI